METTPIQNIRIGDVLINYGYITEEQLSHALAVQKQDRGKRIADILIELGYITESQKLDALAQRLGLPRVSLDAASIDLQAAQRLPRDVAAKYTMIPIAISGGALTVAVDDPMNFFALEDVRQLTRMPVTMVLSATDEIRRAIERCYAEVDAWLAAQSANSTAAAVEPVERVSFTPEADDAPVVKLLNSLLVRGYNTNVSDIHIEPYEHLVNVRMRVDGMIVDYVTLDSNLHQPLIARIKILSSLNIAEKRVPQDGHFRIKLEGMDMNVRVSIMPTVYGEKAVLRFLNTNTKIDYDGSFGMNEDSYRRMVEMLNYPHGIIYFTGPTGSGKSTTLYLILEYLAQRQVNIVTIEDPVEKNVARVNQTQINPMAGMTFESGLRSILRQDPDIIMVGETRDTETAQISVRAAITGHLVLSTLHTNDAISTIVRLEDMGLQRHLIANSLVGVVAQRLVRKVCPDCAYEYTPDAAEKAALGLPNVETLRRGRGCHLCNNTGYRGRISIHEMATIDRELRGMITRGAGPDEMMDYAKSAQQMITLRQAVSALVLSGVTTVEEFLKVTYYA